MKLRRIGNSIGTTFTKEALQQAGFSESDEVVLSASPGEIRIKRASGRQVLELSLAEIKALAAGSIDSKAGQTACAKARKLLEPEA